MRHSGFSRFRGHQLSRLGIPDSCFFGWTTVCVVEGTIEDKYDFHSTANEYFPGLSLEGAVVGWNGGDYVTDNWMKQLNDAGYASEFITTIKWQFSVVLPE